ncbi:hypothetical protein CHS0354_041563 [Potamilus streckersoni]|uniref:Uncharacterized protein n=1 Tax=Potamilus streckersoni TaxID=2493646 RepID=A0AAE0TGF7_9BIVA|nr:hypothetical protein CHS0354_041563 [Potamilus streckersoni]
MSSLFTMITGISTLVFFDTGFLTVWTFCSPMPFILTDIASILTFVSKSGRIVRWIVWRKLSNDTS